MYSVLSQVTGTKEFMKSFGKVVICVIRENEKQVKKIGNKK